jgi:hypothetical protein
MTQTDININMFKVITKQNRSLAECLQGHGEYNEDRSNGWVEHVACMGQNINEYKVLVGKAER